MAKNGPTQQKIPADHLSHGTEAINAIPIFSKEIVILQDEKSVVSFSESSVKFSKHSVTKPEKARICYEAKTSPPPEGHFYASMTLSCSPTFQGQKQAKVILPIICSKISDKEVCLAVFMQESTDTWKHIGDHTLTAERHLELNYYNINNVTAFVPVKHLKDVEFHIACFLCSNNKGKYAMGFCAQNEALEKIFLQRLEKENFFPVVKEMDVLLGKIKDVVNFQVSSGKQHRIAVEDLAWLGHVAYQDIGETEKQQEYNIVHESMDADNRATPVFKKSYKIPQTAFNQSATFKGRSSTVIEGGIIATNYIDNAQDIQFDMREMIDGDPDLRDEGKTIQRSGGFKDIKNRRSCQGANDARHTNRKGHESGEMHPVTIRGGVEAENVIMNVSGACFDMRKIKKNSSSSIRNTEPKPGVGLHTAEDVQEYGNVEIAATPFWENCETEDGRRNLSGDVRRRMPGYPESPRPNTPSNASRVGQLSRQGNIQEEIQLDRFHIVLMALLVPCLVWMFWSYYF